MNWLNIKAQKLKNWGSLGRFLRNPMFLDTRQNPLG